MSVGNKLDELLFNKHVSQKQLAEDLKMSPSTLNNYIRDYREPDIKTLKLIANYFGVTMDYLLEFKLDPKSAPYDMSNADEAELLELYRLLRLEQKEFLLEQTKLLVKLNNKAR